MNEHCFVVTAYKDSPYLSACLNSLIQQTAKSKIIISTSTPSLYIETIAKEYGVDLFVNPENKNVSNNWNFALDVAKAKWITLIHQDDIYLPEFAASTFHAIQQFPDAAIHFTGANEIIENKKTSFSLSLLVKSILLLPFKLQNPLRSMILKKMVISFGNPICCPTVTYNREQLSQFKFNEEYSYVLDWAAWVEIFATPFSIAFTNKPLVNRLIHQGSGTVDGIQSKGIQKEEQAIFEKIWGKPLSKLFFFFYQAAHFKHQQ